jgi:two-component system, sensor histidine kinase YesM
LDYEIYIDESLKSLYVQKLILQPIVENAIYHGIKAKREAGKIEVKAEIIEEVLLFTVTDNGVGISEEDITRINNAFLNSNKEKAGYGLFNVSERIRLSYGKDYGINIKSKPGMGTVVEIRHPVITSLKG